MIYLFILQHEIKFIILQQERDDLEIDWMVKVEASVLHEVNKGAVGDGTLITKVKELSAIDVE